MDTAACKKLFDLCSQSLSNTEDEKFFEASQLLCSVIPTISDDVFGSLPDNILLDNLGNLLKCRLRNEQRAIVIDVYACLIEKHKSVSFLCKHNKNVYLLLVLLCAVEVRMMVENPQTNEILEKQQHLAACYLIIEYTIAAICQSDDLMDDDVSSILSKLIDMFHGCVFLIDQIIDNVEDKQAFDTVLQATVRILGIWLSQEPVSLQTAVRPRLNKWMQYGLNSTNCCETFKKFLEPILKDYEEDDDSSLIPSTTS
ncbi:unnamed protein product [Adineta steineri]|uniref:Neurochondrin-like protein n=1 Tax=Adineta steineri TaxID=433720 RepID=A0A815MPL5_9BILA|nr:unnamed protein product [Adineta steineri]